MNVRNRALVVLLVGSWLVDCRTAVAADWKTLTVDHAWSVDLPGEAKVSKQTIDTLVGKLEVVLYVLELDNRTRAFAANATAAPEPVPEPKGAEIEQRLDAMQAGALANMKAKLVMSKKITIHGFPGREFVGRLANGKFVRQQGCLVRKTLYTLVAVNIEQEDAERFFASFKFLKKK